MLCLDLELVGGVPKPRTEFRVEGQVELASIGELLQMV